MTCAHRTIWSLYEQERWRPMFFLWRMSGGGRGGRGRASKHGANIRINVSWNSRILWPERYFLFVGRLCMILLHSFGLDWSWGRGNKRSADDFDDPAPKQARNSRAPSDSQRSVAAGAAAATAAAAPAAASPTPFLPRRAAPGVPERSDSLFEESQASQRSAPKRQWALKMSSWSSTWSPRKWQTKS